MRILSPDHSLLKNLLLAVVATVTCLPFIYFFSLPTVAVLVTVVTCLLVLLFTQALLRPKPTSAMAEARLQALSSRIRPHFLFNSLNAVIGTIRDNPRLAETSLEEMAELFRALLQDPRDLVPLSDELSLCRKYLSLERLRLGERLQLKWDIEHCPPDALVPPLMLQPLLENAVYHGIEPSLQPGTVVIRLISAGERILIELSNPHLVGSKHTEGNRMALANIRERLSLFYGNSASLESSIVDGRYVVRLVFPYQRTQLQ
jgi:two-component system sensor histidine kinase AlgZ